jgi:LysR family transcriptional regulator, regulator for genes of the gallate degradation pathway
MKSNLRHLRVFLSVARTGSVTRASEDARVSQPAVTQALGKLERLAGQPLFLRRPTGLFPTRAGELLAARVTRAFALLDPALTEIAPRLTLTATTAQLLALIATREAENFTLAARRIGLAQPTIHRAVSTLEQEAGRALFERTAHGLVATRPAQALAQAARLAFAEIAQAEADIGDLAGREVGRIVIGAMPLSRSYLLPRAIARFRNRRPTLPVKALDGPYGDMMAGLRRGEVDFLIGALRDPAPIGDIVQEALFQDGLDIVARPGHPALSLPAPGLADLMSFPFVVGTQGAPGRLIFDRITAPLGAPPSLVETGSMILMRELLRISDHLGCISHLQIEAEIGLGALVRVPVDLTDTLRPIGVTQRADWLPTRAQAEFIEDLRAVAAEVA